MVTFGEAAIFKNEDWDAIQEVFNQAMDELVVSFTDDLGFNQSQIIGNITAEVIFLCLDAGVSIKAISAFAKESKIISKLVIRSKDAKVVQKITTTAIKFKDAGNIKKLEILTKATEAATSTIGDRNFAQLERLAQKLESASDNVLNALNTPLFKTNPSKSILKAESVMYKYGDDTAKIIEKHGDDFINAAERHGSKFVNEVKASPDDFIETCNKYDEAGRRLCFIAGTLISTENGLVSIENIQIGDKVWSFDENTSKVSLKTVDNTFINETSELTHITANGEIISATPEHPFYVPVKGWVNAADLRAGDVLFTLNGEYVTVETVQHEILENPALVYNFEVADNHTYFVGESAVGVHNLCIKKPNEKYLVNTISNNKTISNIGSVNGFSINGTQDFYAIYNKTVNGIPVTVHYNHYKAITFSKTVNGKTISITLNNVSFPDFSNYARMLPNGQTSVKINYSNLPSPASASNADFAAADLAAGITESYRKNNGLVWHHMEDMETMILVPKYVNNQADGGFAHTGGRAIFRELVNQNGGIKPW